VRRSQNWIDGTRPGNAAFVPSPPHRLGVLLGDFERAIHDESELPPLIRVGLLHVQFETPHPYLVGNGRLGRLLITLLLRHWGLLTRPLLYLSLFLKMHRRDYYRRLSVVREEGDWEGWLSFLLEGVAEVADEAVATARRLHVIVGESRDRLLTRNDATVYSLRLFELLPELPILTVNRAVEILDCSRLAAGKAVRILEAAGIVRPLDERKMRLAMTTFRIARSDLCFRPRGGSVNVAGGASIRRAGFRGEIRAWNAKGVIGAPSVAHVDLLERFDTGCGVDAVVGRHPVLFGDLDVVTAVRLDPESSRHSVMNEFGAVKIGHHTVSAEGQVQASA
jgi:hypothetical protein